MNAGRLDRLVTIQKSTSTVNEFGEVVNTYEDYSSNIWAYVEPLSMREYFLAQQMQSMIEKKFIVRFSSKTSGIDPTMKVLYDGLLYNIESVINVGERNRELQLICSRVTT